MKFTITTIAPDFSLGIGLFDSHCIKLSLVFIDVMFSHHTGIVIALGIPWLWFAALVVEWGKEN